MAGSDDKNLKSSGLTNFTPIYPKKSPENRMGQADVAIKIPFIFGIIPPAFMVKMFNKNVRQTIQ